MRISLKLAILYALHSLAIFTCLCERTLEIDEELCVCFIDWQKAFDRVNWTK